MKKLLLLPFLAVVVFGCQPQAEPPAPQSPSTPAKADPTPKAPVTTGQPAKDTSGTPEGKADGKTATAPKAKPGDIPERLYQLRDLAVVPIAAPAHPVKLWVMNNDSKEAEGMMWLTEKDVKDDEGMIFVFPDSAPRSFWMQNTLLPLDIIYLDPKGKVLNIAKGKPKDETSLPSAGNAQYVIELKQGQAEKSGIGPGTILAIPKSVNP